jgi:hypothetical protein
VLGVRLFWIAIISGPVYIDRTLPEFFGLDEVLKVFPRIHSRISRFIFAIILVSTVLIKLPPIVYVHSHLIKFPAFIQLGFYFAVPNLRDFAVSIVDVDALWCGFERRFGILDIVMHMKPLVEFEKITLLTKIDKHFFIPAASEALIKLLASLYVCSLIA